MWHKDTVFVFDTGKVDSRFSRWKGYGYGLKDVCQTNDLYEWELFIKKYKDCPTFGFISYELLHSFNGCTLFKDRKTEFPYIWWGVFRDTYIYDRVDKKYLFNSGKLEDLKIKRLENQNGKFEIIGDLKPNVSSSRYINSVKRIQRFIEQGDVYQVNLTFMINGKFFGNPFTLYNRLGKIMPMPYSVYFSNDDFAFLVVSPELLLIKNKDRIYTRPIKGTIPNKNDNIQHAKNYFHKSIKDNREIDMIIDVERNDFYKICYFDSVRIGEKKVETFPNVHHLVGTIEGKLRSNVGLSEIISSIFPSASVTGAPKTSAIKIINQLEQHDRFIYTGGIGFHYRDILILSMGLRCILFEKDNLHIYTGSGITYKSNPQKELQECMVKVGFYKNLLMS